MVVATIAIAFVREAVEWRGEDDMAFYELDGMRPNLPQAGRYWIAPSADVMGRVTLEPHVSV